MRGFSIADVGFGIPGWVRQECGRPLSYGLSWGRIHRSAVNPPSANSSWADLDRTQEWVRTCQTQNSGFRKIGNSELRPDDLPAQDASWTTIQEFALSFDGYRYWGSFERCAGIANRRDHGSLTELRTCLFFEQRRWRHFGEEPNADAMSYIHGIVDSIRDKLRRAEID